MAICSAHDSVRKRRRLDDQGFVGGCLVVAPRATRLTGAPVGVTRLDPISVARVRAQTGILKGRHICAHAPGLGVDERERTLLAWRSRPHRLTLDDELGLVGRIIRPGDIHFRVTACRRLYSGWRIGRTGIHPCHRGGSRVPTRRGPDSGRSHADTGDQAGRTHACHSRCCARPRDR